MKTLLAIDPGRDMGWAFFRGRTLVQCGLGQGPDLSYTDLVIEKPEIYPDDREHDPNRLITLALRVGWQLRAASATGANLYTVKPKQWKGQVDKAVHNKRVLASLTLGELAIYEICTEKVPESKRNNVIDAVGIGQWFSRQLHPERYRYAS